MKTLYISIIAILVIIAAFSSSNYHAYAPIAGKSTEQLYDESELVVVGKIVSSHEIQDGRRTEYVIQPQEYLKPTTFEDLTKPLTVQGIGSASHFVLYFQVYQVGERALFFLQKEDNHYVISPYSISTESNCNGKQLLALNFSPGDFSVSQGNNTYEKMFTDELINITGYVHNHFDLKSRHMELDFTVHTPRSNVILTEKRQVNLQECTGYTQSTWSFVPTIPGRYSVGVDMHDEDGKESGGGSFCCITVVNRNESSGELHDVNQTYSTQTALVVISKGSSLSPGCQADNSCFIPYQVTVKPGGLVMWHNNDTIGHTVTSGKPTDDSSGSMFDSNLILPGDSFNYTFSNSGNFSYFDQVHPWMTGSVRVGNGTALLSSHFPHFEKRTVPTPLEQFKSGIDPYKTKCEPGRLLVIAADNSPACIFDTSMNMLWEVGWIGKSSAIYAKYLDPVTEAKFQSKIISRDDAIGIVQNYIKNNNITLSANTNSSLKIFTSLNYELISQGYNNLLDVDPKTGLPTTIMPPWWKDYYKNPQWWSELEKYYLGMENKRIEDGALVWHVDYHECECIAPYPMFMVDAITGKVILAQVLTNMGEK
jgi:plastocyanin